MSVASNINLNRLYQSFAKMCLKNRFYAKIDMFLFTFRIFWKQIFAAED